MRVIAIVVASAVLAAQSAPLVQREVDHVAAFARLYGVIRYFHPGDAAAGLDWDRFAVYGVRLSRSAEDVPTLATTLQRLFAPLDIGVVVGTALPPAPTIGPMNPSLVAWRYHGPRFTTTGGPYSSGRLNRPGPLKTEPFVGTVQSVPAAQYRGKTIRFRARARVVGRNAAGWAGLWLRVDRTNKQPGFFDNMQDRPIRDSDWREYVIEGPVADDASSLAFGAITSGDQSAEFDSFELAELTQGTWTTIGIRNGNFEESTGSPVPGWPRVGTAAIGETLVETVARADGQRVLLLRSAIGTPASNLTGAAVENAHVDFDLGSGLKARVRLSLTDLEARTEHQGLAGLRDGLASTPDLHGRSDLDVRLADVVVAWNALRHFYPYWEESQVDWDLRLRAQLALAAAANDRRAHRGALRVLVADARDGHGRVVDSAAREREGLLPVQIAAVDGRLAISASVVPDEAPVGAVVTSLGERPASEVLAEGLRLNSGTTQWREWAALRELIGCASGSTVAVGLELPDGRTRSVALPCAATAAAPEPRPGPIAQVRPGYWYVDLTRATAESLTPALQSLAAARGLIFDVRGYPTDAGFFILPYLIQKPETAQWMHIPDIVGPFGQIERWQSAGWNVQPATPHLAAPRVFLTDGRAISYAESVMGYVSALDLATIVGSTTAGANGNVASFTVPGGFTINFTGMRVTGHDGRSPFHLVGVPPDVPMRPTLAGLRAGRDELLERALEVLGAP